MKKFITLFSTLALISTSPLHSQIFGQLKKANMTEAISNARQIGLAFMEFDNDYGAYPNDETLGTVNENSDVILTADDKSSDGYFRQLFAAGIVQTEAIFFAKIAGTKKGEPEDDATKVLGKGKNAFTYIAGLSSAGNASRPLILCPVIPGTTKFDPKPFDGKAIILKVDNSVTVHDIEDDGTLLIDGKDILSKDHPLWNGKAPDIRYPDIPKED
jgi:hypothetical protein